MCLCHPCVNADSLSKTLYGQRFECISAQVLLWFSAFSKLFHRFISCMFGFPASEYQHLFSIAFSELCILLLTFTMSLDKETFFCFVLFLIVIKELLRLQSCQKTDKNAQEELFPFYCIIPFGCRIRCHFYICVKRLEIPNWDHVESFSNWKANHSNHFSSCIFQAVWFSYCISTFV